MGIEETSYDVVLDAVAVVVAPPEPVLVVGSAHAVRTVAALAMANVAKIVFVCMIMFLGIRVSVKLCAQYATTCIVCIMWSSRIVDTQVGKHSVLAHLEQLLSCRAVRGATAWRGVDRSPSGSAARPSAER